MKFIKGNEKFTNNIKQLLTDPTIFDRILLEEPSKWENILWAVKKSNLNGKINPFIDNKVTLRACYQIYLENHIDLSLENITFEAYNVFNNLIIDDFESWGIVKVKDNTYLLFTWLDIEERFNLTWTNPSNQDWYIKVVI